MTDLLKLHERAMKVSEANRVDLTRHGTTSTHEDQNLIHQPGTPVCSSVRELSPDQLMSSWSCMV